VIFEKGCAAYAAPLLWSSEPTTTSAKIGALDPFKSVAMNAPHFIVSTKLSWQITAWSIDEFIRDHWLNKESYRAKKKRTLRK